MTGPRTFADWTDGDDADSYPIPASTLEMARELATSWGLFDDHWSGQPAVADLLRPPGAPVSTYDAMAGEVSYGDPASQPYAGYPGITEIRARMGI
jgi:hypothetical protein